MMTAQRAATSEQWYDVLGVPDLEGYCRKLREVQYGFASGDLRRTEASYDLRMNKSYVTQIVNGTLLDEDRLDQLLGWVREQHRADPAR